MSSPHCGTQHISRAILPSRPPPHNLAAAPRRVAASPITSTFAQRIASAPPGRRADRRIPAGRGRRGLALEREETERSSYRQLSAHQPRQEQVAGGAELLVLRPAVVPQRVEGNDD